MKKNVIFDFGGVIIDWNPHNLYDGYFGDPAMAQWFIDHICTMEWNAQMDAGKPFAEGIREKVAEFPEWEKEIRLYGSEWRSMLGEVIPGTYEVMQDMKACGCRLFGLSNWSAETFPLVENDISAFGLLEGIIISGREGIVKPDAAIYRLLLARFSLLAEDCLFIDDRPDNTAAAEAVGIQSHLFTTSDSLRKAFWGP